VRAGRVALRAVGFSFWFTIVRYAVVARTGRERLVVC